MKFYKRIIALVLAAVLMFGMVPYASAATNVPFEGAWNHQNALIPVTEEDVAVYEVTRDNACVRSAPYQSAATVMRVESGQYIKGKIVVNNKHNEWICFEGEDGTPLFIFSGNVRQHQVHCWRDVVETPSGDLLFCECGYVSLQFAANSNANLTVDGLEYIKQVMLGNYSKTHSFTAAFSSMLLGLTPVGPLMDVRDLSADLFYCAIGDCDIMSLVIDFVAFVPLLDCLKYGDSLRAVKVLDASDLQKYTNSIGDLADITGNNKVMIIDTYEGLRSIYAGKSVTIGIENHHLVEKRFGKLFDVDTNMFISTPLYNQGHDVITARWRTELPYTGGNYDGVTYQEMVDAINSVYEDNQTMRQATLKWAAEHWCGKK